jgi:hypothetical protein
VPKRPSKATDEAKRLANAANSAPIDLARALWNAERQQPGAARELARSSGLGLRKAYYLLQIWGRLSGLRLSRSTMARVGWTKLALVANHAEPGAEKDALDLAEQHTAKELETYLRTHKAPPGKTHSLLFRFTPKQHRHLTAVLQQYGAKPVTKGKGLVNKEAALIRALRDLPPPQT